MIIWLKKYLSFYYWDINNNKGYFVEHLNYEEIYDQIINED